MLAGEIRSRRFLRQIIADDRGLRWKEKPGGEWHTAGWDEVTDFYLELPDAQNVVSASRNIIHFRDGRTLAFSGFWSNWQPLCKRIAERSANAEPARLPDGTIWWAAKGTRPADLPASFSYSEDYIHRVGAVSNRNTAFCFVQLLGLLAFWMVGLFTFGAYQWITAIGMILWLRTAARTGLTLSRRPKAKQVRDAERRAQQQERLEVTRETITFWKEGEKQVIPWSDIVGYDQPILSDILYEETVRIRTITGKEFSVTSLMEGVERFTQMLPLYAPDAVIYRRGKNEKEALGGEKARWTGGEEGKGDKVFHRRTRTNRNNLIIGSLILTFLSVMGALVGIPTLIIEFLWSPIGLFDHLRTYPYATSFLGIYLLILIPGLKAVFQQTKSYFRDRIVVGKEGVRLAHQGKETTLRWDSITNSRTEANHISLEGVGGTIKFTPSDYAYGNELPDLIKEHLARTEAETTRAASASDVAKPETQDWTDREPQTKAQQIVRRTR